MSDPKPFASLTSSLLARKGAARPAMRRPGFGGLTHGQDHDDLGWNDMGEDQGAPAPVSTGLTPMPHSASHASEDTQVSPAIEQQRMLEQKITALASDAIEANAPEHIEAAPAEHALAADIQMEASPEQAEPVMTEAAAVVPASKPKRRAKAAPSARTSKAAFTLRLDPERHLRLRLSCALSRRSAQQIVTDALDEFLKSQTQVDALVETLPRGGGNWSGE